MCVCVYHVVFIRSRVSEHLGGLHVLAAINSAAVNTDTMQLCVTVFSEVYAQYWACRVTRYFLVLAV